MPLQLLNEGTSVHIPSRPQRRRLSSPKTELTEFTYDMCDHLMPNGLLRISSARLSDRLFSGPRKHVGDAGIKRRAISHQDIAEHGIKADCCDEVEDCGSPERFCKRRLGLG